MYHEQFPAHKVQAHASRPPQEAYKSGGAFDGTTTSRAAYTAHPIPPRSVSPADRDNPSCASITSNDVVPCLQVLLIGRYLAHVCTDTKSTAHVLCGL